MGCGTRQKALVDQIRHTPRFALELLFVMLSLCGAAFGVVLYYPLPKLRYAFCPPKCHARPQRAADCFHA